MKSCASGILNWFESRDGDYFVKNLSQTDFEKLKRRYSGRLEKVIKSTDEKTRQVVDHFEGKLQDLRLAVVEPDFVYQ